MNSQPMEMQVVVNGELKSVLVDPRLLLVQLVRDHLGLKGTRIGCLTGDCGACTLLLDGQVIKSCLTLAVSAKNHEIVTIEGCSIEKLQQAFVAENGFQCGYCTTGMLLIAADLLRSNRLPNDDEIRTAISGNLCRCTGYDDIIAAIRTASRSINRQRTM
jgi:carbon-monoxide dehydrogenase small subunit